mgnify:CR=1 FL=1|tara:strand:- start:612 stop:908 length:297 start_codon:yes stop_codon:yes gene_type:complete
MSFTNETFYKLLATAKEQQDCNIDNFAITLEVDGYIVECYKWYSNFSYDNTLNFDSCGSIVFGKYEDITLTDYQCKLLEDRFDAMSDQWLKEYEQSIV